MSELSWYGRQCSEDNKICKAVAVQQGKLWNVVNGDSRKRWFSDWLSNLIASSSGQIKTNGQTNVTIFFCKILRNKWYNAKGFIWMVSHRISFSLQITGLRFCRVREWFRFLSVITTCLITAMLKRPYWINLKRGNQRETPTPRVVISTLPNLPEG